jgi:hypothetical protein
LKIGCPVPTRNRVSGTDKRQIVRIEKTYLLIEEKRQAGTVPCSNLGLYVDVKNPLSQNWDKELFNVYLFSISVWNIFYLLFYWHFFKYTLKLRFIMDYISKLTKGHTKTLG